MAVDTVPFGLFDVSPSGAAAPLSTTFPAERHAGHFNAFKFIGTQLPQQNTAVTRVRGSYQGLCGSFCDPIVALQ